MGWNTKFVTPKTINKKTIIFNNNKILNRYNKNLDYIFLWMKKLKLKEPTILDIGANIGLYSICYSKIYKNCFIHAFEPVPKNFKTLSSNLKKNKLTNIKVSEIALLDKKKTINIGIPDRKVHDRYKKNINDGLFSIFAQKSKFKIKAIPLDLFIKKKKIKKVDFIKIDVEGAEALVLQGGIKTIKSHKPIIQLEYNDLTKTLGKKDIEYFREFAIKNKYNIFYLVKNYKLKKYVNFKKNFISDLIFINKRVHNRTSLTL